LYPDQLKWENGAITTYGKHRVIPKAASTISTDLRGSMALVIGALLAEGESVVENVEMALRGYNKLEQKLNQLGVKIATIEE
jgi:UDP-N-acetylglucosamine 1-carboxyvinyltransferase